MGDKPARGRSASGRVTLKMVAAELGITPMTVSNAYNRPDQLSPALRTQVFDAARRLGYAGPDPTARGLRRGRTGAVGVVYDSRLSYAFADAAAVAFLRGVSEAAEHDRLGLLLIPGSPGRERDAAVVGDAMVDGFVVYSVAQGDPLVAAAVRRGLPTVVVDQPRLDGVPFVGMDDAASAETAAALLLDLGHRRLGVVSFALDRDGHSGPAGADRQRSARYPVTRARLEGYAAACAAAGLPWSQVPVVECPGSSRDLGRGAGQVLLSRPDRPTAVLATSDELALGVVAAAQQVGLAVPDDLSVVGFDDIADAANSHPPLTTVRQDHVMKGRLAGRLLSAHLRGEAPMDPPTLTGRLVVRGSSAPAGRQRPGA